MKLVKGFFVILFFILQMASAGWSASMNINGYVFDDNSASLTNPWSPMALGDVVDDWKYYSSGTLVEADIVISALAVETVYGVKCLKVRSQFGDDVTTRWYAQDTVGNIHALKKDEHDGDIYVVDEDGDIPNISVPGSPEAGESWQYGTWSGHNQSTMTVMSTSYTYNGVSGCLRIREGRSSRDIYDYYKIGVGRIAADSTDGELIIRSGFDSMDAGTGDGDDVGPGSGDGDHTGDGVTIAGYSFAATSAAITNMYFPITPSFRWDFNMSLNGSEVPADCMMSGVAVETVQGVSCLKIRQQWGDEINYRWYAQDTLGNVHELKKMDADGSDMQVIDPSSGLPNILIPASVNVNDQWPADTWGGVIRGARKVVSDDYLFGGYAGCIRIEESRDGRTLYNHYKAGIGFVGASTSEGYQTLRTGSGDTSGGTPDGENDGGASSSSGGSSGSSGCFIQLLF